MSTFENERQYVEFVKSLFDSESWVDPDQKQQLERQKDRFIHVAASGSFRDNLQDIKMALPITKFENGCRKFLLEV